MQPEHEPSLTPHDLAAMRRALALAAAAGETGETPVGAVVYHPATGQVIAEGANTRHLQNDPAGHAELIAIREAAKAEGDWRLNHLALAVTLEPCPMCAGAIVNARVGRLIIGAMDSNAGACGSLMALTEDPRLNHRVTPITGVLADESAELLRSFFRARRGG